MATISNIPLDVAKTATFLGPIQVQMSSLSSYLGKKSTSNSEVWHLRWRYQITERKPYLDSFKESRGMVTLEPAEKQAVEADTPAKCAKSCIDEDSFNCRSFQFCQSSLSCLLHKKSYLDRASSQLTTKTKSLCSLFKSK
ncbi:hypothetical protein GQR58_000758 [Nymphon striatum]|nr:hypothetical protein GQR58_000758 [Nymphon striatum]